MAKTISNSVEFKVRQIDAHNKEIVERKLE
jgi:hypothetical protein